MFTILEGLMLDAVCIIYLSPWYVAQDMCSKNLTEETLAT